MLGALLAALFALILPFLGLYFQHERIFSIGGCFFAFQTGIG
jgi:hypothetical protein